MRDRSSEGHRVEEAGLLPLLTDTLWLEDRGRKFRTGVRQRGILSHMAEDICIVGLSGKYTDNH